MTKLFLQTLLALFSFLFASRAGLAQSIGTQILPLANEAYSCINVAKQKVTFFISSVRIPDKRNLFQKTVEVGALVNVGLATADGKNPNFPAAQSISIREIPRVRGRERIIAATLQIPILVNYDLSQVNLLSTPLTFMRVKGDTGAATIIKAVISIAKDQVIVPVPPPFAQGLERFGQFFNKLDEIANPKGSANIAPNFQLRFPLGARSVGCAENELRDGVGVQIVDFDGSEKNGIIRVADSAKYCFYKRGSGLDPEIAFTKKAGATCPTQAESDDMLTRLDNPQVIWVAHGGACTGEGCPALPKLSSEQLAQLKSTGGTVKSSLDGTLPNLVQEVAQVDAAIKQGKLELLDSIGDQTKSELHKLALCASVGIRPERCSDSRVRGQVDR